MSGHVLATRGGDVELRGANPYLEWGVTAPPPPGSVGGSIGGLHVTTESATQIAAVYGCCGLLADSVASLPLRALDAPAHIVTSKEIKTPPLLENPYELISLTDWLVCFIWSLALRGNFFGQVIERDGLGYPTQIMPVSADIVRPDVKANGEVHWRYAGKLIPDEDVFHVRYQSMPGWLLGINPIQAMKYPFGLAHVLDVHAESYFANSADPQGVLEAKGKLTEDSGKKLAAQWKSAHQGPNLGSTPAVLDEETKFNPISINPEDQQLLQSRQYSAEEISGLIFRIPPHMLGLTERSTSFGRGIEQQERGFVANTLSGYLCRLERALTACLPKGTYVNFDISHRIRGAELERAQTGSLGMLGGFFTADEVRGKYFDMPALPNGEGKFLNIPINTELLQKALEELKKLEAEPDEPPPPQIIEAEPPSGQGLPQSPAK
jgi:HK97 family phage portal protein